MADQFVNGINTTALGRYIGELKQEPGIGKYTFRARNRWAGGAHSASTIQDFEVGGKEDTSRPKPFVFDAGEPAVLLGENEGPNATEAALHALSTCVGTTLIYHAAAHGVTINALEVEIEGDLDIRGFIGITDEVRRGYNQVRITFKVSADAPEERIREVCQMGQRYSPVFDIVTNRTPVQASMEITGTGVRKDVTFHEEQQRREAA
jgi:uncharacterized OsmC-like protein